MGLSTYVPKIFAPGVSSTLETIASTKYVPSLKNNAVHPLAVLLLLLLYFPSASAYSAVPIDTDRSARAYAEQRRPSPRSGVVPLVYYPIIFEGHPAEIGMQRPPKGSSPFFSIVNLFG